MLLLRQQMGLQEHQQRVDESKRAVLDLLEHVGELGTAIGEQRLLRFDDLDRVQQHMEKLAHACTTEVAVFATGSTQLPESLVMARLLDADVLSRGVSVRNLYLDAARNDPATEGYAQWLVAEGGEARTTPHLPVRMVIYDRRFALLPADLKSANSGAIVLESPGAVAALQSLFDQMWRQSTPFHVKPWRDEKGLSERERVLLRLLAEGDTDEAIAHKLAVSVRTVRRVIAELMKRLGARSRFEAGALALARGWLDSMAC
ncbi:LuxR C-terminal-related transcriptional regulator (plasmid) [Streptomyces sp. NBC_00440]|uniref:helix-turn-helix transcriptional regulator n=1 Tax=unclassified Streptomyces TaxID=2593676 RepID=UPI002E2220E3|nr:LuxR C-terminal-related transcriptional regulator [Streptomyces sp. NBC_00963]